MCDKLLLWTWTSALELYVSCFSEQDRKAGSPGTDMKWKLCIYENWGFILREISECIIWITFNYARPIIMHRPGSHGMGHKSKVTWAYRCACRRNWSVLLLYDSPFNSVSIMKLLIAKQSVPYMLHIQYGCIVYHLHLHICYKGSCIYICTIFILSYFQLEWFPDQLTIQSNEWWQV